MVPAAVLTRFAGEGYVYRGRVQLAALAAHHNNPVLRAQVRAAKEGGAAEEGEAAPAAATNSSTAAVKAALTAVTAAPPEQAAESSRPASSKLQEGNVPENPQLLSSLAAKAAEPRGEVDVAIVRVDSAGNLYTKT